MTALEINTLVNDLALQYTLDNSQDVICGTVYISDNLYEQIMANEVLVIDRQIQPQLDILLPALTGWALTKSLRNNRPILCLVRQ